MFLHLLVFGILITGLCPVATGEKTEKVIVTTLLDEPFIERKDGGFSGFGKDLLDTIARTVGFEYEIRLTPDGRYGGLTRDGKWNGMVGEVANGRANMTLGILTISYMRNLVVDFSMPFMKKKLKMLVKKPVGMEYPDPLPRSFFYFLRPFTIGVWVLLIIAFLMVSVFLILLNRFNPYEWGQRIKRNPQIIDPEGTGDQFGVRESFWFVVSTLMFQGYTKRPLSLAGRILVVFWFSFCVIIIVSYVAVLMNTFSAERPVSAKLPFRNIYGLVRRDDYTIGTINGGSTQSYFKTGLTQVCFAVWNKMKTSTPSPFVNSTKAAIERVRQNPKYVYIGEGLTLDYVTNQMCDLMTLDVYDDYDSPGGYGFAFPKGSPLKNKVNAALLKLIEEQLMELYFNRWYRSGKCAEVDSTPVGKASEDPRTIGLDNVGGIFIFLALGFVISLIVGLVEFVLHKRKARESINENNEEMGLKNDTPQNA